LMACRSSTVTPHMPSQVMQPLWMPLQ
jgi:hypothetical protein